MTTEEELQSLYTGFMVAGGLELAASSIPIYMGANSRKGSTAVVVYATAALALIATGTATLATIGSINKDHIDNMYSPENVERVQRENQEANENNQRLVEYYDNEKKISDERVKMGNKPTRDSFNAHEDERWMNTQDVPRPNDEIKNSLNRAFGLITVFVPLAVISLGVAHTQITPQAQIGEPTFYTENPMYG